MTKRKQPEPRLAVRIARSANRHPRITWASIGALLGVLIPCVPGVWWIVHYYEPADAAIVREANIRKDLSAYRTEQARVAAWQTVTLAQMAVTVARNRVNDCDVKEDKRERMTALERAACAQYHDEFRSATQRFDDVRRAALAISGGT
jgi:hypothetical protein